LISSQPLPDLYAMLLKAALRPALYDAAQPATNHTVFADLANFQMTY